MQPPSFLIGQHPKRGALWAAIDRNARFTKAEIAERLFAAYLAPFSTEDEARAALAAAGAQIIEPEAGGTRRATRGGDSTSGTTPILPASQEAGS